MAEHQQDRRGFLRTSTAAIAGAALGCSLKSAFSAESSGFQLRYILGSSMYGTLPLADILPEVHKTGSDSIDIWPRVHGNQREQIEEMGHETFGRLLEEHEVQLGISTRYDLGPFGLQDEMKFVKQFGGKMLISGARGPKGLTGSDLKAAVEQFAEQMRPHIEVAEEHGLVIGIENHGNSLIESPDSLRWFIEAAPSPAIGIALAPYHLEQDAAMLARLIEDLGERLVHFYAWEHGMGCHVKLPKEQELLQMPGRGSLDFRPIVAALKKIHYQGWTEIFMHPVPRGIPILPTAEEVTAEINRSRRYLEAALKG